MNKISVFLAGCLLALTFPVFAQAPASLPGQIAYIGTDFNVYSRTLDQDASVPLTDDAAIGTNGATYYQWPTWANDGQLAYFKTVLGRDGSESTDVMVSPDGITSGVSAYHAPDRSFTYASWAPQGCGVDCHDLAVLLGQSSGFDVQVVHAAGGHTSNRSVGQGSPFYFSWSPDGAQMLWQRDNQQFAIYDLSQNQISRTLTQTPGATFAPAWSPVDDRLLLGALNGGKTDLVVANGAQTSTLASQLANPIWFSWSPNGQQVAYIDRQGPLLVLDAASGKIVTRSPVSGVMAFFWSPDSAHLAYVTLSSPAGTFSAADSANPRLAAQAQNAPTSLAWSVLDVADGANRRYSSFVPTSDLVYLLTYFDQFAPSHRLWSPDSRDLVFAEVTPDHRQVIDLLDTTQTVAVPLVIANGTIGIWSFK